MTIFAENSALQIILIVLLSLVVITDITQHKIPNKIVIFIILTGIGFQVYINKLAGLNSALLGILLGFSLFIPFYLCKAMRAGDVKLMSSVGAYLGIQTFLAVAISLIIGMLMAIMILIYKKEFIVSVKRYWIIIKESIQLKSYSYHPPKANQAAMIQFPYAPAITLSTMIVFYVFKDGVL